MHKGAVLRRRQRSKFGLGPPLTRVNGAQRRRPYGVKYCTSRGARILQRREQLGPTADKIPSAEVLFWMSFLFGSFILSYPWALAAGPTYFCLWTMIIHLFEGGNFALYPVIVVDLYGLKYSGKLSSFICGLFSC